jgi:hypothetical protein
MLTFSTMEMVTVVVNGGQVLLNTSYHWRGCPQEVREGTYVWCIRRSIGGSRD